MPDDLCTNSMSCTYKGTRCVGEDECDCTDGLCKLCCKEKVSKKDGSYICKANLPIFPYIEDEACEDGFSRTYGGTGCAGPKKWQCDCGDFGEPNADGVPFRTCTKCCKEIVNERRTEWNCDWQHLKSPSPPPLPPPPPRRAPRRQLSEQRRVPAPRG